MSIYVIGDVQGCLSPLKKLVDKINFDPLQDRLWFTGDLINRGPESLETLRWIKAMYGSSLSVLGNHDLNLLAVYYGAINYAPTHHHFEDILEAPDSEELIDWLRHRPLLHYDPVLNCLLVHAGLYPLWDLEESLHYAKEAENALRGPEIKKYLIHLYGDSPNQWQANLNTFERFRFICNVFTCLRFCTMDGIIDLKMKGTTALKSYYPWFSMVHPQIDAQILFGHWSALRGQTNTEKVYALDTGCVWGNELTAMRLDDSKLFKTKCL